MLDLWRLVRGERRHWGAFWPYIPLATFAVAYLVVETAALSVASEGGGYGYSLGGHVLLNLMWYPVVLIGPFTESELFDFHRAIFAVLGGSGSFGGIVSTARFGLMLAAHLAVLGAIILIAIRGPGWARVAVGSMLLLEAPFVLVGGTMFHFAYLPAAFGLTLGVAALASLAQAVADRSRIAHAWIVVTVPLLVAVALLARQTHENLDNWEFAAGLSHRLVQSAHSSLGDPDHGVLIVATGLPNTVRGAYVFREGFQAALRVTYGRPDLRVQVFSKPVFERLLSQPATDMKRYFLVYEPNSLALRLVGQK